jgi:arylsulfatase A-like enzyme
MLQERFREAGFRTISSSASPLGSTLSGLERGFDLAHPPARWADELGPLGHPDARQVQAALLSFIDEDPSRPVFGYLHTLDVHEYERPMFEDGDENETPYDRAIRHQDAALGELLKAYARRKRDLVLVLVSDHGEGFGEYGLEVGHGYSVRQNQLHVPIVFHGPRWLPKGRVVEPASLVDIAPTLLDLYSLPPLPQPQGRSLLPGGSTQAPSAVYAERTWFLWKPEGEALLAHVGADGRKLVTGYPRPVSWDLAKSPCEDTAHGRVPDPNDMAAIRRFEQEQRAAAEQWDAAYGDAEAGRIDPGDIARLRALGYLE